MPGARVALVTTPQHLLLQIAALASAAWSCSREEAACVAAGGAAVEEQPPIGPFLCGSIACALIRRFICRRVWTSGSCGQREVEESVLLSG